MNYIKVKDGKIEEVKGDDIEVIEMESDVRYVGEKNLDGYFISVDSNEDNNNLSIIQGYQEYKGHEGHKRHDIPTININILTQIQIPMNIMLVKSMKEELEKMEKRFIENLNQENKPEIKD